MKIKLAQIKAIEEPLAKLADKELDIRISYRLGKFIKVIGQELQELETNRIKLIKKYGKPVDNKAGQQEYQIEEENKNKFIDDFNKLLQEEINVDFSPISLEELKDVQLTPVDVMRLEGIVIVDNKKKEKEVENN